MIHLDWSFFECILLNLVNLDMSLIPLEGVKSLLDMRNEAILNIEINSHVSFNKVTESLDNLVGVLIQKSLESSKRFKFIEILFEFSIKVGKNI